MLTSPGAGGVWGMKKYLILTLVFAACGTINTKEDSVQTQFTEDDTSIISVNDSTTETEVPTETYDANFATYYVLVADTSQDYQPLYDIMFEISADLNIPIDTMGRSYNSDKNLIALADDDEDEIYAGDYYPRRFPSGHISLEYLNIYKKQSGNKTIALVTGIYETETSADSALVALREIVKHGFKLKSEIYISCMH